MDKLIIANKEGVDFKNIYISIDGIKTLDKNLGTKEHFLSSFSNKSAKVLGLKDDIPFDCIKSVSVFNEDFGLQIKYIKKKGNVEMSYLEFDSLEELNEVKKYIILKSNLKIIDSKKMYRDIIKKRYIISFFSVVVMIVCFLFLTLPRFTLVIIILVSAAFIYWLKLPQLESSIVQEKYIK